MITAIFNKRQQLFGNVSGVYFLFDQNELVYIGQSWNCLLRVAEHTRKYSDKVFTSWNYLPINDTIERKGLERELIQKYHPKHNKI